MSLIKTAVITSFNSIRDALPDAVVSVAYKGDYRPNCAVRSTNAEAQVVSLNGEDIAYAFSIRIPCAQFDEIPQAGETMTIKGADDDTDGTEYGILAYVPDSMHAIARVDLGSKYA